MSWATRRHLISPLALLSDPRWSDLGIDRNFRMMISPSTASGVPMASLGLNTSRSRACQSMNRIALAIQPGDTVPSWLAEAVSSATFIRLYLSRPSTSCGQLQASYMRWASGLTVLTAVHMKYLSSEAYRSSPVRTVSEALAGGVHSLPSCLNLSPAWYPRIILLISPRLAN